MLVSQPAFSSIHVFSLSSMLFTFSSNSSIPIKIYYFFTRGEQGLNSTILVPKEFPQSLSKFDHGSFLCLNVLCIITNIVLIWKFYRRATSKNSNSGCTVVLDNYPVVCNTLTIWPNGCRKVDFFFFFRFINIIKGCMSKKSF